MSEKPRVKRVSVSVREGPKAESLTGKVLQEAIHDVFNCCSSETCSHHRKSLADRTLTSESWTSLAISSSFQFAREGMVKVARRESGKGETGETYSFGNVLTAGEDDETLDDFQRAVRCLKSDYKTFAASNFDRFIKENEARAMDEVWPQLQIELKKTAAIAAEIQTDTESFLDNFHEPASRKLPIAVVALYRSGNDNGAREILSLIFALIPSLNKEVSLYWVECLEKLVESCNSSNVQKDIFPKIAELARGGKAVSINGKIGVCRLLRKLAKRFNADVIEKKVFPMMDALAKEENSEVRIATAKSLPEMIHRIRNKDEALGLINIIKEDTDPWVRAALTSTIVKSITLMNPREEKNKSYLASLMQTIKILVKEAYGNGNIELLVAYSEYMGYVCQAFTAAKILKPRDVLWYLDAFLQLSKYDAKLKSEENPNFEDEMPTGFANFRANMEFARRHSIVEALISTRTATVAEKAASQSAINTNRAIAVLKENAGSRRMSIPYGGGISHSVCVRPFGPEPENAHECRRNAANQFYDFMLFAKPIVGFRHGLHPLVTDLMHDPKPDVRAAMALNIFPIMDHLGAEAGVLHGEFVYALSDDDLDVIQAIVANLARILKCFVGAKILSPETITPKLVEIGGAILYCEERLNQTTFYKVHQLMLEQFTILPHCLPGDYVYNNFVPALLHRLRHMRVLPCRMAAARAIVVFLRHCRRSEQREEIRRRIKTGFAQGRSVHDRMLFLYMAKKIMVQFDRKYFRDHFFDDVLLLANDPIGNVRMKVMELMPELKEAIFEDLSMQKALDETFHNARKSEVDRDVKAKIDEVSSKFNSVK